MTTTITLTPPAEFINVNQRYHWRKKAKLTKAWRDAARLAALDTYTGVWETARVVCSIRFATNHRRDAGNYYPTAKAIVDGLVDAAVFPDDDDSRIVGPDMRRHIPNGSPLVTITITPLEDS